MAQRTSSCTDCGAELVSGPRGPLRSVCSGCRSARQRAKRPAGPSLTDEQRSEKARKASLARWSRVDQEARSESGRHAAAKRWEGQEKPDRYPRLAGPPRPCEFCDEWLETVKQRICGSPECKRLYNNARQLKFYADHLAEHGVSYTNRYSEKRNAASKEYRRTPNGTAIRRAADHRRRVRLAGGRSERFLNEDIFERDAWVCGICGESVDRGLVHPDPASPSLDHIVPISLGGDHVRSNVRLAHLSCNVKRGARGADEQLRLVG